MALRLDRVAHDARAEVLEGDPTDPRLEQLRGWPGDPHRRPHAQLRRRREWIALYVVDEEHELREGVAPAELLVGAIAGPVDAPQDARELVT